MFGMIPFVKAAGRGLGALIKGRKGKETLKKEVDDLGLDTTGVEIEVDDDGGVSLIGEAVSQEMKEKIILAVGNVEGVGGVNDQATSRAGGRESQFLRRYARRDIKNLLRHMASIPRNIRSEQADA